MTMLRWLLISFALALLCGLALERCLPQISRPYWEDEVHHNFAVLNARSALDLPKNIKHHMQPCLDYLLRMYVWLPIVGQAELSFRLPSLASRLLVIAGVFSGGWLFLRRQQFGVPAALTISFLLGWWVVRMPTENYLAVEARHYAFVSLMSLLWAMIAVLPERPHAGMLFLGSFLFANTHFFAVPLILAVYLMEMAEATIGKDVPRALRLIAALGGLLTLTVLVNFKPLFFSFQSPLSADRLTLSKAIAAGMRIWWDYQAYLALPAPLLIVWLPLFTRIKKSNVRRLLACIYLVMPAFFIYVRLRTSYNFSPRYYTPYLGLGVVAMLLFIDSLVDWIKMIGERWPTLQVKPTWTPIAASLVGCLAAAVSIHDLYSHREQLALPAWNFSPYYHNYAALQTEKAPVFLLAHEKLPGDVPLFYLNHVARGDSARRVPTLASCMSDPAAERRELEAFLQEHPDGVIALDKTPAMIQPSMLKPASMLQDRWQRHGIEVEETNHLPCFIWKVRGARGVADLAEIAKTLGFQPRGGLFSQ